MEFRKWEDRLNEYCYRGFRKGAATPITTAVFFTSYNPVSAQTDSTPCIGATGVNLCEYPSRVIALSQELVGRHGDKLFTYGDKVRLRSDLKDERCNGEFTVLDTMNKRFTNRGDIFTMDPADNVSCYADLYTLN